MKNGVITGMILVIVIVVFLCLSQLAAFVGSLAEHSAQAELARGQSAAMVAQAQAQGDLMRAQAAITLKAADAVAEDTKSAHGMSNAQAVGITLAMVGVLAFVIGVAYMARQERAAAAVKLAEMQRMVAELTAQLAAHQPDAQSMRNMAEYEAQK